MSSTAKTTARAAGKQKCDGPRTFEFGARLNEFEIRRASSKLWPPQVSFTMAVRTTEWLGPKLSIAGVACEWTLGKLGPWRGAIVVLGIPIPVYATIPLKAKADVGSLSVFRLNHVGTTVLDLDMGKNNNFSFSQQGSNTWVNGVMDFSGDSELSVHLDLQVGVGDPKAGNLNVAAGFGPSAKWKSGRGCDLAIDLGSLSAGVTIGPIKAGTPSWTPLSWQLWHGCDTGGGSSPGGGPPPPGGGGSGGGASGGGRVSTERFRAVASGPKLTCGIRLDETVQCWGEDRQEKLSPPQGAFSKLALGVPSCGLRPDGSAACWAHESYDTLKQPPAGPFDDIVTAYSMACGMRPDETVACWSSVEGKDNPGTPSGTFQQITAGDNSACGLRPSGTAECWRYSAYLRPSGDLPAGTIPPPGGTFVEIGTGGLHICGRRVSGQIACWGYNGSGESIPPPGTFTQLSVGFNYTCGLRSDQHAVCWGSGLNGATVPSASSFTKVSAGDGHACGLRPDGYVECWGANEFGQSTPP